MSGVVLEPTKVNVLKDRKLNNYGCILVHGENNNIWFCSFFKTEGFKENI